MDKKSPLIQSILYKQDIESACAPLKDIGDIGYFVLYIIFNDGKKFVLSSNSEEFLSFYWNEKYFNYDHSTDINLFLNDEYYLCDNNIGVEPILGNTLESKFNMFRTFYVTRKCPECRFVFGAIHNYKVIESAVLYDSIIEKFEDFCVDFIDRTVNLIKFHNPNYNRSIILNDKYYRKSIIKRKFESEQQLTEREVECLYWAANGKSSDETAIILGIKKHTVEEYRKNIKFKLNCSTMTQAVYEGVKRGYIGAFHRIDANFFEASKENRTIYQPPEKRVFLPSPRLVKNS